MPPARKKISSAKTGKLPAKTTRQRIVESAIAQFNRYGIQNVAIDHIATDLGISPGNLTYHFKRKDDLIHETLDVLKDKLRVALERPVSVTSPNEGADYLIRMYRTLWDVRFFFNSLAYLLQDDRSLRKEFFEFRDWLVATMESDLEYLARGGYMNPPVAPNSFRLLSENIWGHLLSWLRLQQIETPSAKTPSAEALYDALLHLWSMSQLWMEPAYAKLLLQAFETQLELSPLKAGIVAGRPARTRKSS
ncbi:TetR/AcrR family transcriptional regulator [Hydrocarboniphaga sp.]|uniref:TetR/AcrR family transcriptional regulator n=1 Tax=Hydrocarboniphaga sp. TaxID=2033016 RepID=UPI003D0AA2CC